jgi:hypothetical protein
MWVHRKQKAVHKSCCEPQQAGQGIESDPLECTYEGQHVSEFRALDVSFGLTVSKSAVA